MNKKKTKLKDLNMTSVDFVRRGANQNAEIMLYKSAGEDDIPQRLWKNIRDAVNEWWNGEQKEEFSVEKSEYISALEHSLHSIAEDETMDSVAKSEMGIESIGQFAEALAESFAKSLGVEYEPQNEPTSEFNGEEEQTLGGVTKSQPEETTEGLGQAEHKEEGENTMKIDKSRFTADELEQYQALIAKAVVEEEEEQYVPEEEGEEIPTEKKKTCKSELHPEVAKALAELEDMKKSMEMKEMHEVAKSFSVLGKKEDEMAETLYTMKKSSPEAYDSYVALLNEQVEMVNKSGLFQEIGKSGRGYTGNSDVESKIESIASDIQKADPNLSRYEAIGKAWDQNPELLAEYEAEYQGGRK